MKIVPSDDGYAWFVPGIKRHTIRMPERGEPARTILLAHEMHHAKQFDALMAEEYDPPRFPCLRSRAKKAAFKRARERFKGMDVETAAYGASARKAEQLGVNVADYIHARAGALMQEAVYSSRNYPPDIEATIWARYRDNLLF